MVAATGARRVALPATFIAALACALPIRGRAQSGGAVSGTVTDPDGQPLSGVVVELARPGLSVATNATGRYVLRRVPAGHHTLRFHRVGYAPLQLTVDVTADTPLAADAVLDPQPIELGTVLVEGVSRAPDRVLDAPAAVEIVRPATAAAASITGQVPLALTQVPGLDVVQGSVSDFDVNARGFNTLFSRKMLVLQDGRDLALGHLGAELWQTLSEPLEDLGQIEVIRGPGSALYGPNAYNGVINITTPDARDVVGTKFTLGGGELTTARADLRHAGLWLHDRLGYRVNVGYTRSDDWTRSRTAKDSSDWREEYAPATSTPPRGKPDSLPLIGQTKDPVTDQALGTPDPAVTVYGSGRVDYYAANGSVATLEGGTARADNSVLVGGFGRTQFPRILRPWARVAWRAHGSGVSAWYSGASFSTILLRSGTTLYADESLFHLEGRTSRPLGEGGRVVVGASVQDDQVNSKGTILGLAYDDRSDQHYGAFAQLEYGVGRLRLIGSLRWDDSDLFPAQLSPKGALVWRLAEHHALRLTVDRAVLAPALPSLFGTQPLGSYDLRAIEANLRADPAVGPALAAVPTGTLFTNSAAVPESAFANPHLVPQTATSYEVGYKGQFGQRIFVTLDAYEAHVEDFLTALLPAGTTGLNPDFKPWTAPSAVPVASRAAVESAVPNALASLGGQVQNGLTRLADGTTAIALSAGNAGSADEWGVELGTSVVPAPRLSVSASYTWYNFAIYNHLVGNVMAPNTPQNKGTVTLMYAGRQGIELGVDARIVSRYHWRTGVWDGDVPASEIVNLNAGCRISPHLRVYANATDLFNQQRFQVYGGAVIGRRVLAGVTSTF